MPGLGPFRCQARGASGRRAPPPARVPRGTCVPGAPPLTARGSRGPAGPPLRAARLHKGRRPRPRLPASGPRPHEAAREGPRRAGRAAQTLHPIAGRARRGAASTSGLGPRGGRRAPRGRRRPRPASSGSRWARGAAGGAARSARTRRTSARSGPSWWPPPPRR